MENIDVTVRIRPQNQKEIESNDIEIWSEMSGENIGISLEKYDELIKMRKLIPGQKLQFSFSIKHFFM